jgi:hypothetical protein
MPAACKISHTVDGAIVTPSFMSSPWIRRCPHSGFSFARRTTRRAMPGTTGGRPGLRRLLVSYFFATSLRCQASSVAGVTGKTSAQRPRGTRQRDEPGPVSRLIPYPAGLPPQDRVLVPEYQQFSILRQVTAAHQDGQAEHPACKQVHDLEQYPPTQPSPRLACWRTRRSAMQSSIRAAQPCRYLHDEQHIQPPEEDHVHREEVTRQQALGLRAGRCARRCPGRGERAGRAGRGGSAGQSPG